MTKPTLSDLLPAVRLDIAIPPDEAAALLKIATGIHESASFLIANSRMPFDALASVAAALVVCRKVRHALEDAGVTA